MDSRTTATRSDTGAFAIVEIAVALMVLAIALTVMASLFAVSRKGVRTAQVKMAARYIAEHQIGLVRTEAAAGEVLPDVSDKEVPPGLRSASRLAGVKCLLTVRDESEDRPGLKRVTVVVRWDGPGDRPLEYELESLVAERRRQ